MKCRLGIANPVVNGQYKYDTLPQAGGCLEPMQIENLRFAFPVLSKRNASKNSAYASVANNLDQR